jgi:hypothetical protein
MAIDLCEKGGIGRKSFFGCQNEKDQKVTVKHVIFDELLSVSVTSVLRTFEAVT